MIKSRVLAVFLLFLTSCGMCISSQLQSNLDHSTHRDFPSYPTISSSTNAQNINATFEQKLLDFDNLGYFPQIYEPSLQAMYYAIYSLGALGNLSMVSESEITDYIMSKYDPNLSCFADEYAYRYLDTDFNDAFYPLTSLLEVNCYALLSLGIIGRLDVVYISHFIDFIWSCYNPITGGFIGRPYNITLNEKFKLATADNTYFAVLTLDMLMANWFNYETEKQEIIDFLTSLQSTYSFEGYFGGFFNDLDTSLDTLGTLMNEPNLLSSYYCIETLHILENLGEIRTSDFHQYLSNLYDDITDTFSIHYFNDNFMNIVATSLGLVLSDLTEYDSFIDRYAVINFIVSNRDSPLGNWRGSTEYSQYELIDTFQIVRALYEAGEVFTLGGPVKNEIALSINYYSQYEGYSLLSHDYTSMNLIHDIITVFETYDRLDELNIEAIYSAIKNSYMYIDNPYFSESTFVGYLNAFLQIPTSTYIGFRSKPIEYYSSIHFNYTESISRLLYHKTTFEALDSLIMLSTLGEFEAAHDLQDFIKSIISTQFLELGYSSFGGFLPTMAYTLFPPSEQNKRIFLEYSFYAIRTLELLCDYLGINFESLLFDKDALKNYVMNGVIDSANETYFQPHYSNSTEIILQNTYYMIYILQVLNSLTLNPQKIHSFLNKSIDYENIKNIYYCYKISEMLNLDFPFNNTLVHYLVQQIYSSEVKEYYTTIHRVQIDQDIFSWICEMAIHDDVEWYITYPSITYLGTTINITASLQNLIIYDSGLYTNVTFESGQLGIIALEQKAECWEKGIYIESNPINYPIVYGFLRSYIGPVQIDEFSIAFNTTYDLLVNYTEYKTNDSITININASQIFGDGMTSLTNASAYALINRSGTFFETVNFSCQNYATYSNFSLTFTPIDSVEYLLDLYVKDKFQEIGIGVVEFLVPEEIEDPDDPPNPDDPDDPDNPEDPQDPDDPDDPQDPDNQSDTEKTNTPLRDLNVTVSLVLFLTLLPGSLIIISTQKLKKLNSRVSSNSK